MTPVQQPLCKACSGLGNNHNAGAVYETMYDKAGEGAILHTKRVLSPEAIRTMHLPATDEAGYGSHQHATNGQCRRMVGDNAK